jgi:PKHD-type hydroxylase
MKTGMFLLLSSVLSADDLAALQTEIGQLSFADGRATAGAVARQVKRNEQASGPGAQRVAEFVRAALERHPVFAAAAQVQRFSPVLVSRYGPGMEYGWHVDNALIQGVRSDLAFTVLLQAPDGPGGELQVELPGGVQTVKLVPGDAVLYPATTIHRVTPVQAGHRIAAVGWIESRVREADRREVLFDVANLRAALAQSKVPAPSLLTLQKIEANLIRLWSS